MASESPYKILPTVPEDIEDSMAVGDEAFLVDRLTQAALDMLQSDESRTALWQMRKKRNESWLRGSAYEEETKLTFPTHLAKVVYTPIQKEGTEEQMVALCCWFGPGESRPQQPEGPKEESKDVAPDLKRVLDFYKDVIRTLDEKTKEFMSPERNTRYWYLRSLATLPGHQQRGLGSMLLRWGIEKARADTSAMPEKIKGVWTIATPHGLRTYEKAGMNEVGSTVIDCGMGVENGQKYVWMVKEFDEGE